MTERIVISGCLVLTGKILVNEKGGCGAIWWLDMWYSAKSGILFDCRAYYWVVQNVIPDWHRFLKWECGLYMLCGVLDCGCMGGLIYYVKIWDLYCDPLWHDNVIWFLSAVGCMVIWFGWSGLILYSLLYMGRLWECLFLWLSVWKLCRIFFLIYVVDRVCPLIVWSVGLMCVAADIS